MRDEFTALLLGQTGYHEGRDGDGTWNNRQRYSEETPGLEWSDGQPWCATFEAWGAHRTGMDGIWPMTASCLDAVAWWRGHNRWTPYPVLGGPFYLGPGGGDHTGVVYAYDADTIYTVEGNTNDSGSTEGDGVYRKSRARRGPGSPYGYGVPAYPEGTVSADPALGGIPAARTSGQSTTPAPGTPTWPGRYLRVQSPMLHGDDVLMWQQRLAWRGWAITADGWYGPASAQICRAFQQRHGLSVDGVVGPVTWNEAWN
ncbi:peptidoglycan-binding domain-containing protein [Kitasatospora sp. CB01950]|uniref:peptidoglycan-binding domain-containing protein n=1 Tax=Kitasatospora sp. CB01950 TaxID=1703930 RepID=UPI00093C6814|nr:peptidoglycan-binding protein [Kitasatospora sp. CB01950]